MISTLCSLIGVDAFDAPAKPTDTIQHCETDEVKFSQILPPLLLEQSEQRTLERVTPSKSLKVDALLLS
jgi:hypothetical protein